MNDRIDLLKKQLTEPHSDKERIDLFNSLANELKYIKQEEALAYAEQALHLAIEIDYLKGIAYSRLYMAVNLFLLSRVENILENLLEAIDYFGTAPHESGYAIALNYTGNVYESYGNYEKGLEYCQKALKIAEQYGYIETKGDAFSTIGIIYTRLADYNKAIESFKESLKIREDLKSDNAIASSLNWMARSYSLSKDYTKALEYYMKSIELRKKTNNAALPWSYLGIASLYENMGETILAVENYAKSLELNEQTHDKRCNLHCYIGMGKILSKQQNTQKGNEYLIKSLKIAESLKSKPILFEIHLSLAENYEKLGNLSNALKHYRLYQKTKEEVLNSEMLNKLKYQQINFAVEKSQHEAEIFQLRNVELRAALKQVERKNQEITDSIEYANRIQTAMLPLKTNMDNMLSDYFILFKPKSIVSGDFYWLRQINSYIVIAAADCTGHGVPGAFMSMLGISFLNEIVHNREITQTNQILNELRIQIKNTLKQTGNKGEVYDGMDIALCALETKTNKLQYSGANNSLYKTSNFQQLLFENHSRPMIIQMELLEQELKNWMKGYDQTDDILVMGVRV